MKPSFTQTTRVITRSVSSRTCLEGTNKVSFLNTLGNKAVGHGENQLPFTIPATSWLRTSIGNTPLMHLHDNIYAKLEGHSPGGSVKDRTLSSIVLSMFKTGELTTKGDTLVLVTSGSAGMSLTHIHEALKSIPDFNLNVVVVMPQIYAKKQIPAEIIDLPNTRVFTDYKEMKAATTGDNAVAGGSVSVLLKDGVFMDVLADTKKIAKEENWVMLDQHYDQNSMDGHRSTAQEILMQCPGVTDVVCATGTGATAAGLLKHLPETIKVHSRPAVSGSIDGLSDVNRYNNFCNTEELDGYTSCTFSKDAANTHLADLETLYNIEAGPSTGATYWLATQIKKENPGAKIVFIGADAKMSTKAPQHVLASNKKSITNRMKIPVIQYPFFKPLIRATPESTPQRSAIKMNCYTNFNFRQF